MLCAIVHPASYLGVDRCGRRDLPATQLIQEAAWTVDGVCAVLERSPVTGHLLEPTHRWECSLVAGAAGDTQQAASQWPQRHNYVEGGAPKQPVRVGPGRYATRGAIDSMAPGHMSKLSAVTAALTSTEKSDVACTSCNGTAASGIHASAAAAQGASANTALAGSDTGKAAATAATVATVADGTASHDGDSLRANNGASCRAFDPAAVAAVAPTTRPYDHCLPYTPYIRRTCVFTKIPGYDPAQITPGYEQRLALRMTALGGGGNRRLGSVYVRSGCVELIMEEEVWGEGAAPGFGDGVEEAAGGERIGGDGEGIVAAAEDAAAAAPPARNEEQRQQQQQLQRRRQVAPDAAAAPASGGFQGSGNAGSVSGGGAWYAGGGLGALPPPPSGSSGFRSHSHGPSSRNSSLSSMDLAAIIQALQLRDEQGMVSEDDAEAEAAGGATEDAAAGGLAAGESGSSGGVRLDAAAPSDAAAAAETKPLYAPGPNEPESRRAADGAMPAIASQLPTANRRSSEAQAPMAPFLLGFEGERQTGIRVVALQPRVLLLADGGGGGPPPRGLLETPEPAFERLDLPPAGATSPTSPPPPQQQQRQQQQQQPSRYPGRARNRGGGQYPGPSPNPNPGPSPLTQDTNPDLSPARNQRQQRSPGQDQPGMRDAIPRRGGGGGGAASAAATAAAAATLCAALYCPTGLTAAEGPGALEVLLRSQGHYLPLRARWRRSGADAPAAAPASDAEAEANVGSRGEDGRPDGGGGAVVPRELPDAMLAVDVNQLQLLELELLELPVRPGIALVDFRWRNRPCRAVPLVLTSQPAVAAELQAAAAGWSRPQAELDELLLDYGTWEFHVSTAVRSSRSYVVPPASAPAPAPSGPAAAAGGMAAPRATAPGAAGAPGSIGANADSSSGSSSGSSSSGRSGPLQPLSATRLLDLSSHLLRYVSACGWVRTAEHIRSQLYGLSTIGAGAAASSPAVAAGGSVAPVPGTGGGGAAGPGPTGDLNTPAAAEAAPSAATATPAPAAAVQPAAARAGPAASGNERCKGAQPPGGDLAWKGSVPRLPPDASVGAAAVRPRGGGGEEEEGNGEEEREGEAYERPIACGAARPGIPWASAVLLPALGLGRTTIEEAAAFEQFAEPWVNKLSSVLLQSNPTQINPTQFNPSQVNPSRPNPVPIQVKGFQNEIPYGNPIHRPPPSRLLIDLLSLAALLLRERQSLLSPFSASSLMATAVSLALVLARFVLPYGAWVRLLRPSRYARVACYCAAKGLVALAGVPLPRAVHSNLLGGSMLLMEGVILPAASVLPPAAAALSLSALAALTAKMLLTVGAVTHGSEAALHGLRVAALGFATTVACHAYLRYHFGWQQRHPRSAGVGTGHSRAAAPQLWPKKGD